MDTYRNMRPDEAMEAIVEMGICECQAFGTAKAWAFLENRGVPLTVIERVLNQPALRRDAMLRR